MSAAAPPAKDQMLDAMGEVIADRAGVDLMLARSIAGDILATLQRPGREAGLRSLAAQDACDVVGRELIEALNRELLIVFLKRLGGKLTCPVSEVDDTGGWIMALAVDAEAGTMTFEARQKQ